MKAKIVLLVMAATFFMAIGFTLPTSQCWAQAGATQANLEKVKQGGKLTEAEVKSLMGEPKKTETETKAKGPRRELNEIAILYYEVGGKEVRVYIDRTWGYLTKVIED